MKKYNVLIAIIIIMSGFAHSFNKETIDFELINNRMIVNVSDNIGNQYKFLFDTGASGLVINKKVFDNSSLERIDEILIGSPNNSNGIPAILSKMDSLNIGNYLLKNVLVTAVDLKRLIPKLDIDGIVGPASIGKHTYVINYDKMIITLTEERLNENDPRVIKAKMGRLINIPIQINGKTYEGHLDSGSKYNINIPFEWKNQFKLKTEAQYSGTAELINQTIELYDGEIDGVINIGNISISNPEVKFVTGGFNAINIGLDFLRKHIIKIDYESNKISIE